jgi:hypothetical protein
LRQSAYPPDSEVWAYEHDPLGATRGAPEKQRSLSPQAFPISDSLDRTHGLTTETDGRVWVERIWAIPLPRAAAAAGGVPVSEENDRGLCFHVEYHDFDLVVCSDINGVDTGSRTDVESAVAPVIGDVEVVKVNHHGSSYSSNATYVDTLRPEVAVISVGKNGFGHPSQAVVDCWDAHAEVFQTQNPADNAMIDGNITIATTDIATYTATASASPRSITRVMDGAGP